MEEEKLQEAKELLRREFGAQWKQIAQTIGTEELTHCLGRDLTSFMAFPERKEGGNNAWRGNCSPEVVRRLLSYVQACLPRRRKEEFLLLDPMCGSGTSGDVAREEGIQAIQYDLNPQLKDGLGGWDALKDDVRDSADFIFLHPPYHSIIRYSGNMWGKAHEDDLSRCKDYQDYIGKLNFVLKKLFFSLRSGGFLGLLVCDIRKDGAFYSIANDVMTIGTLKSWIVKGQFNCMSSGRSYAGKNPFIPIVTEHLLLFKKEDAILIPYSFRRSGCFALLGQDSVALTWFHLIYAVMEQNGGSMTLGQLYQTLKEHPKAQKNQHYKERIRASIYEHRQHFLSNRKGSYRLKYQVTG